MSTANNISGEEIATKFNQSINSVSRVLCSMYNTFDGKSIKKQSNISPASPSHFILNGTDKAMISFTKDPILQINTKMKTKLQSVDRLIWVVRTKGSATYKIYIVKTESLIDSIYNSNSGFVSKPIQVKPNLTYRIFNTMDFISSEVYIIEEFGSAKIVPETLKALDVLEDEYLVDESKNMFVSKVSGKISKMLNQSAVVSWESFTMHINPSKKTPVILINIDTEEQWKYESASEAGRILGVRSQKVHDVLAGRIKKLITLQGIFLVMAQTTNPSEYLVIGKEKVKLAQSGRSDKGKKHITKPKNYVSLCSVKEILSPQSSKIATSL